MQTLTAKIKMQKPVDENFLFSKRMNAKRNFIETNIT